MLGAAGPSPVALRGLYAWLDGLPLSRPKRHLARDFSDGVMLAEIVKHFHPRLVDLHNYTPTCNTDQKLSNWHILNRKVFPKLSLCISETDIRKVVASTPGAVEPILCALREKVEGGAVHTDLPGAAVRVGDMVLGALGHLCSLQPCGLSPRPTCGPAAGWASLRRSPELRGPICHVGLPSPPALSSMKTAQNESAAEKMGQCTCRVWVPVSPTLPHVPTSCPLLAILSQLGNSQGSLLFMSVCWKLLQVKVDRLEHLVELKDRRIAELARPRRERHGGSPGGAPWPESARP
uniref:Calponin-homology (CH) domain-containing protein n=1 Tax=Prolemur simus TaxID=1328070 RepID=A0A8C8ZWG2_PROSS